MHSNLLHKYFFILFNCFSSVSKYVWKNLFDKLKADKSGRSKCMLSSSSTKKRTNERFHFAWCVLNICRTHSKFTLSIFAEAREEGNVRELNMKPISGWIFLLTPSWRKYNQIYIRLSRDTWAHSRVQIQFLLGVELLLARCAYMSVCVFYSNQIIVLSNKMTWRELLVKW